MIIGSFFVAGGWGYGFPDLFHSGHEVIGHTSSPPVADLTIPTAVSSGKEALLSSNEALINVAKLARPAVVNISTVGTGDVQQSPFPFFNDPFFRRFFGEEFGRRHQQQPPAPRERGLGSGVIVSTDGYIITNNHVVKNADEIKVLLSDRRTFSAKVIGTDPKTDLAVIKVDATGLPAITWGDSSRLQVGEIVMAIGNPFGLNQTVTMGIISAVGRANVGIVDYEDFIQTDAAINPGNSGGALVNLRGELVGINTAIFSRSGGYMGIGFAIPSNMAKSVKESLVKRGKVIRGWLGVSIQDLTPELKDQFNVPDTKGALVSDVLKESPAKQGGLKRGDVIRQYDGHPVRDSRHLRSLVAETTPHTTVRINVLRDGNERGVRITIGEMPKNVAAMTGQEITGNHALAGVTVGPVPSGRSRSGEGVSVINVESGSPADRAGIRQGDILLEINRQPVRTVDDFDQLTQNLGPDETILVLLQRGQTTIFLSISP